MTVGNKVVAATIIILGCLTACGLEDGTGELNAAAQACMTTYSRVNGYGFDAESLEGVQVGGIPVAGPDGTTVEIEDPLGTLQSECEAGGGSRCDLDGYTVTPQAAVCMAEAYGLAAGIAPWERSLIFNHDVKTVVWIVQNTTRSSEDIVDKEGEFLMISAATGELLERGMWGVIE
jgi:hypothetical protein